MSEIKALDKLRAAGRNMAKGRNLENNEECNLLLIIADEIQAEVDERFMALPLDVDGVPIRVGDTVAEKPFRPKAGEKPAEVVCMLLNSDGWAVGDCDPRGHWYNSLQLEHVKPRTLEDVLIDAMQFGFSSHAGDDVIDKAREFANEIRELMKEGGDG